MIEVTFVLWGITRRGGRQAMQCFPSPVCIEVLAKKAEALVFSVRGERKQNGVMIAAADCL